MQDRFIAGLLFGAAAALLWLPLASIDFPQIGFGGWVGLCSAITAAAVGAAMAPRLASGNLGFGDASPGMMIGVYVTIAAYVVSAVPMAFVLPAANGDLITGSGVLGAFVVCLLFGLFFLVFAIPLGMVAGSLFWRYRSGASSHAV